MAADKILGMDRWVYKVWMLVPDGQADKSRMFPPVVVVDDDWILTLDMAADNSWMLAPGGGGFNEDWCLYQTGGQTRLVLLQWE